MNELNTQILVPSTKDKEEKKKEKKTIENMVRKKKAITLM